jgi:drug/metabolite transporter (DMT)-like permease
MVKVNKFDLHNWGGNVLVAVLALVIAYVLVLRAIDTGSLQQYAMVILLVAAAGYCIVRAIRNI